MIVQAIPYPASAGGIAPVLRAKKSVTFAGSFNPPASIPLTSGWDASYGDGNANYAPAQNDIVIVTYNTGTVGSGGSVTVTEAGYNEVVNIWANGSIVDTKLCIAWKRMGGTPDTSVQVSETHPSLNTDAGAVIVEVWSGVNTTTAMDVAVVSAQGIDTDGKPDAPAITPLTSGAVIVVCGGAGSATGAVFTQAGSELSDFLSATQADTYDAMVGTGWVAWTSGAFNPVVWTGGTAGASDSWVAACLALRPA